MPAFQFHALDASGRPHKGQLEGDTPRQIRQQLRERGLTPIGVSELSGERRPSGKGRRRTRLKATDLTLITRQLATLIGSGLPIEQALSAVARQSENTRVSGLVMALRARINEGHSLAASLADFPYAFPELYRATVAAGEQAGHLAVTLERLADYTETRQALRQKVSLALFYPLMLTGVALLIVFGLLTYVVPQIIDVFASTQQTLPALTRGLISLSAFMEDYGLVLGMIILGAGISGYYLRQRPVIRYAQHRLQLRLPIIGRLIRGLESARFARTMSILLASGVPALEALRISAQVLSQHPLRQAVEQAAVRVREGSSLHAALDAAGVFPPLLLQMIASGEASGRLENMLERAAAQQERETETVVAALLALFEPVLILTMGAVVLTIVLAILLPIFELNQLVQ
jgi:general secretion pathway protein F